MITIKNLDIRRRQMNESINKHIKSYVKPSKESTHTKTKKTQIKQTNTIIHTQLF